MSAEKIILITGASSGVGRVTARLLAEHGCKVLGTSRNPDSSEAIPNVEMLKLDVRSDASVRACVDAAGSIDVLVNNAGYELAGAVEETSLDELTAQFETNFFGVARMIKGVLPIMRPRKHGRIVNVSSLAGMVPIPFMGVYSASKFALEGYTAALRQEVLPFNIHVSLVEVGFLRTPMMQHRQVAGETIEDYDLWRRSALDAIVTAEQQAPGPELVAQTVLTIVESAKPRLRYVTGREAHLVSRLQRWLPEAAFEKGVRRTFGLDRRK
jgi:NAD(P)-dependent dehydrogenase (short-subunit alcohol dehydrogenase family)